MADTALKVCFTDTNGYTIIDGRFWGKLGNGEDHGVCSVNHFVLSAMALADQRDAKFQGLFINGHGAPGFQGLGSGEGDDTSGDISLQVDSAGNLRGDALWSIPMLAGYFTDDACVTLLGCQVAAGDGGKRLLKALSMSLQVPVRGADAIQYHWLPGWEGNLWLATPDGRVQCIS
jgi:hypothetical protein